MVTILQITLAKEEILFSVVIVLFSQKDYLRDKQNIWPALVR